MTEIKLLLFDFGGVIAPEGFQLGILKLAFKFNISFKQMYEIAGYKGGLESGYTAGKISEREYWDIVARALNTDEDLMKYRYLFIDNFPPRIDMMELIKTLREEFKVAIFSDQTNWLYDIDKIYGFMSRFDYCFVSYDLGYTKYDDEFYMIPTDTTSIKPENMLLFDDKKRVIDKASGFGIKGHVFTSVDDCKEYLDKLK